MSRKLFNYISVIITALTGIALGTIGYFNVPDAGAWEASIPVIEGAIITVLGNFVKDNKIEQK